MYTDHPPTVAQPSEADRPADTDRTSNADRTPSTGQPPGASQPPNAGEVPSASQAPFDVDREVSPRRAIDEHDPAATFDPTDTRRLPNTVDEHNQWVA